MTRRKQIASTTPGAFLGGLVMAGLMKSVFDSTKKCACYQEGFADGMEHAVELVQEAVPATRSTGARACVRSGTRPRVRASLERFLKPKRARVRGGSQ